MKKLFLFAILSIAGTSVRAQLTIVPEQQYTAGQSVLLHSQYGNQPCCPDTDEVFWQLTLCDPAGNAMGEPVLTANMKGSPTGEYILPRSEDLAQGKYLVEHSARMGATTITSTSIIITMECKGCRPGQLMNTSGGGGFLCYPNPASSTLYIQLPGKTTAATAELFNATGQRVDAFEISNPQYTYTVPATCSQGMYLLRLTVGGTVYTQHVVLK